MSVVTNIVIHLAGDFDTDATICEFNRFVEGQGGARISFVSFDYQRDWKSPHSHKAWYGGSKYLEADLYCGSLNHFELDAFVSFIASRDWPDYAVVQLMVKEQEDEKFRLIDVISSGIDTPTE